MIESNSRMPRKKTRGKAPRRARKRRAPAPASAKSPLPDHRTALLLALLAFLVYNANLRIVGAGDTYPARFLPFALWNHGTLHLDPIREVTAQRHPQPYWIQPTPDGHWASLYPVVTPLLAAPLYLPAALWVRWAGETYERMTWLGHLLEKLSASFLCAAAVGWMYLLLRRRLPPRDATLLTLAFAFGTATWATSSQALWQHGPAELLMVGTLWFLTGELTTVNLLAAGLLAGLLAANRPPDLLFTAAFGVYALLRVRQRAAWFALAAAVPGALAAAYNLAMFHHINGGYGVVGLVGGDFFAHPVFRGLAGMLVSPGRGLFVFSPFLLFLPILFYRALADRDSDRLLTLCLAAAALLQLLLYAPTDWRGGFSYGYRFLSDMVPALIWLLAPVVASLSRPVRAVFVACCLFAVWVQAVGAFQYLGLSDIAINDPADREMRNVWKIGNSPLLVESRQPLAPRDLWHELQAAHR